MKYLITRLFVFFSFVASSCYFVSCEEKESISEGIQIVHIHTDTAVYSKDIYVKGTMQIEGDTTIFPLQIKGRGNSTWKQPKKPYKLKFNTKIPLFGMPEDKEYALLANYLDKSLLRNDVAFEISERIGMAWTPRRKFVDVYLNGKYEGNYLLTETVSIGKERLDINLMSAKKPNDTTNSFLVEVDARKDGKQFWEIAGVSLVMKEPDSVSQKQLSHIQSLFENLNERIGSYQDARPYINLDTWIKWVIVNELTRNRDAIMFGSVFFYRDTTNRIAMGPVWDFDLSAGAYDGSTYAGWYVNEGAFIGGMFRYHPYYKARFKEIWNSYKNVLSTIPDYIEKQAKYIHASQDSNFVRWKIMDLQTYDGQLLQGSYGGEVNSLINFLDKRYKWMDSTINTF